MLPVLMSDVKIRNEALIRWNSPTTDVWTLRREEGRFLIKSCAVRGKGDLTCLKYSKIQANVDMLGAPGFCASSPEWLSLHSSANQTGCSANPFSCAGYNPSFQVLCCVCALCLVVFCVWSSVSNSHCFTVSPPAVIISVRAETARCERAPRPYSTIPPNSAAVLESYPWLMKTCDPKKQPHEKLWHYSQCRTSCLIWKQWSWSCEIPKGNTCL